MIIAVENVTVPSSTVINDLQAIDIPPNYASLFAHAGFALLRRREVNYECPY